MFGLHPWDAGGPAELTLDEIHQYRSALRERIRAMKNEHEAR